MILLKLILFWKTCFKDKPCLILTLTISQEYKYVFIIGKIRNHSKNVFNNCKWNYECEKSERLQTVVVENKNNENLTKIC